MVRRGTFVLEDTNINAVVLVPPRLLPTKTIKVTNLPESASDDGLVLLLEEQIGGVVVKVSSKGDTSMVTFGKSEGL